MKKAWKAQNARKTWKAWIAKDYAEKHKVMKIWQIVKQQEQ